MHILVEALGEVLVTAKEIGSLPKLVKVKVRAVPVLSFSESSVRPLKTTVAGLTFWAGLVLGLGGVLGETVKEPDEEGPAVLIAGVALAAVIALESGPVEASGEPRWPTIIRAPATPISSAHTTPRPIDKFLQILSSTRLLLSDPSTGWRWTRERYRLRAFVGKQACDTR
jgi:hypothetical protein